MKKISKAAENKLIKAIEKTAVLVNDGMDPSKAIAKAASEDGIPPGNINLMVHAYNTGRTTRQRQSGEDALTKSADFPLADASKVLDLLYPENVKTAAAIEQSTIVSTQYAIPPTGLLERREKRAIRQRKLDWTIGEVTEAPAPYPTDPKERMKRAYANAEKLRRESDELRRRMSSAFDKMASTFMDLTNYFRQPGGSPIPVVSETAFLLHGDKGRQIVDEVVKVTPGLAKMSMHKVAAVVDQTTDNECYALISQLLDEIDFYKEAKRNYEQQAKEAAESSEALLRPFVERPRSVLEGYLQDSEKEAGMLFPSLVGASALKSLFGGAAPSAAKPKPGAVQKQLAELTDPEHEQRLRNIQTSAMLQDMMINDPVISGYDPTEATDAFNEIVQTAPRAANKRAIMQSLMRKRLEQGTLDAFEVQQLLDMEEKQQKIDRPPTTVGMGDVSVLA